MENNQVSFVDTSGIHEYVRKELELFELLNELDKMDMEQLLQLEYPETLKEY